MSTEPAFEHCAAATPPSRTEKIGPLELALKDHALQVKGLSGPFAVAAFAGPAPGAPLRAESLAAVRSASPSLVLVIGGFGENEAHVTATLRALSTLPMPVLLLQGGRDRPALLAAALEAAEAKNLFDVSGLHRVQLGRDSLIPVPGSAHGRYALDASACGHALDDIKARAETLGAKPKQERRFLLAWEAPAGGGALSVSRDAQGVEAGDPDLGELVTRTGALGGVFAWPHLRAAVPVRSGGQKLAAAGESAPDLQLVVPRLGGPPLERASGALVGSSFALLTFDQVGMRLDALVPVP